MKAKILIGFIALSFFIKPYKSSAQVNVQDSLALVDFYDSTYGKNWGNRDQRWDLSTPVGNWYGIGITNNRVTSIQLWGAFDSGRIPSSFGNLTALTTLNLIDDDLTDATLPESFSNLVNLRSIKMSAVFYYLPFPTSITRLPNLRFMDFQNNVFTDSIIPPAIGNMTQLHYLDMGYCFVNKCRIPSELGNLKNLAVLILNNNNLFGAVPGSFANMDFLGFLEISANNLSGPIPGGLNNLKNFSNLFLNDNAYTFQAIEPFIQSGNASNKVYNYLILNPQANIPIARHHEKLAVSPGGTLSNDTLRWYKSDRTLLATIIGDTTYTPADTGRYYVAVSNAVATGLTLNSDLFKLNYFLADTTVAISQNVSGTSSTNINEGILKLATLTPTAGANALNGNVTTTVTIDTTVSVFNGQPYVQRHYDITPATNATTAQATVTLFFTQQDFDNFNSYVTANALSLPLLPTGGVNNGNVRIIQLHGSFTATPDPENYHNSATVFITPGVVWDNVNSWWAITFPVNGFSGFFLSTANFTLPLTLLEFKGKVQENTIALQWLTTLEVNTKEFIIERSINGTTFNAIGNVIAHSTSVNNQYDFIDLSPLLGNSLYRLKMIDKDGSFVYSYIVPVKIANTVLKLSVYPNPVINIATLLFNTTTGGTYVINVTDLSGKIIKRVKGRSITGINEVKIDLRKYAQGTYLITLVDEQNEEHSLKLSK